MYSVSFIAITISCYIASRCHLVTFVHTKYIVCECCDEPCSSADINTLKDDMSQMSYLQRWALSTTKRIKKNRIAGLISSVSSFKRHACFLPPHPVSGHCIMRDRNKQKIFRCLLCSLKIKMLSMSKTSNTTSPAHVQMRRHVYC